MTPISYKHLTVEDYASPNYSERKGEGAPKILVMHYTAGPIADEALNTFASKISEVSAHYLIPPNGEKVYRLVEEEKRAWHAGDSYWGEITDVNSFSIGIENVNWGYTYGPILTEEPAHPFLKSAWSKTMHATRRFVESSALPRPKKTWYLFPEEQMQTLAVLSKQIIKKYSIAPENVVGHSDIAPGRKSDPGPLFNWAFLAENGVGDLYDSNTDRVRSNKPLGVSIPWMQKSLAEWGYKVPQNGSLDPETKKVVEAFQMHFRSKNYEGSIDEESANILDLLLCQRRNRSNASS